MRLLLWALVVVATLLGRDAAAQTRDAVQRRTPGDGVATSFLNNDASPEFFQRCKKLVAATTIFVDGSTRLDRELSIARTCHVQAEEYRLALRDQRTRTVICEACRIYGDAVGCSTARALRCAD